MTSLFPDPPIPEDESWDSSNGSEVYHGRIEDKFTPVVREKLEECGVEVMGHVLCDDDAEMTTGAIADWIEKGADMVVCTGGMSVDPDDRTPLAIVMRRTRWSLMEHLSCPVLCSCLRIRSGRTSMRIRRQRARRISRSWTAWMCYVFETHNLRSRAAAYRSR